MIIKKLQLENYRNYVQETFIYSEGLNVVCGKNAQGKTNSAEAIFMLCTGYSPRVKKDKQVIRYGEDMAKISAEANTQYGDITVDMTFFEHSKKRVRINDVAIGKMGELLGNIDSVFFNPSELKLIQESPEDRRRFMDISLSQMNKKYFYALKNYNDVLSHRNSLLKEDNRALIIDTIKLWDSQLIDNASIIIKCRNEFIRQLTPFAVESHSIITDGKEHLEVEPTWDSKADDEEIKSTMQKNLNDRLERDMILGYTSFGPHRDDLKISLNGDDIKLFGSQGQQRTASLSLKLSELQIFKTRFNEYPLLILDDAMSELDESRQKRLLQAIKNVQTIITCTSIDKDIFSNVEYKQFDVSGGRII